MTNKHPSKLDGLCMDASTVSGLMLPVSAAEEGQEEKKNFQTVVFEFSLDLCIVMAMASFPALHLSFR
ncbi:hypothetical protein RhiirA1_424416 [Rhizophagus irregularis]|uniref:Uncharacterized protein n=1 Tax=Rhizophagus irregularis TaxID=588596 RepID=A0A2I1E676_9GLOM|nr:hypothetical protein RhiirA1_424416 [Rhizophagus irregularis]PKY17634.1 hypothetical protein RhiirB3_404570 [Rhizophagus irregularis]